MMEDCNEFESTSRDAQQVNETDRIPTHFLVELTSLDELAFPANSTKRVKYTCVASTSRSLILGTSTGTVYVFSRYAAKSRSRASQSPVPVHVFTTRDGQISTIAMNSTEEMMAIGGESGRVSVAQLNNGQTPTLLYTVPGDARSPDRVAALAWSSDGKHVYSGHSSGNVHAHRLGNRSVFRASHHKMAKFDGEITQLDVYQDHIIVATTIAAFLYHVENGTVQQIGKKARNIPSVLGACYIRPADGNSGYIVAARPNGRLWESNLVGVVYRTHQFRQNAFIPRAPPVSFRSAFPTSVEEFEGLHPENQDVSFNTIHFLSFDGRLFLLSAFGSRICIFDIDTSKVVLVAEVEHDILDVSTCGNDVFVLFADSKGLRKYSVFERLKCIEKLNLKSHFIQSAQFVIFLHPDIDVRNEMISKIIDGLAMMSKKKETEKLQIELNRILEEIEEKRKESESMYDNLEKASGKENSKILPSGVHKVLANAQESGYADDFQFHTPQALRERSRSSPCGGMDVLEESPLSKMTSEPSNLQEYRKNGTPDVVEEDILHRARRLLEAEEGDGQVIERESLRTLLQLEGIQRDEIRFTPTVTIGNAAKALAELALSVPVDFDEIWRGKTGGGEKRGPPTIVKVVRPGIRPRSVTRKKDLETTTTPTQDDVLSNNVQEDVDDIVAEERRKRQDEMWLDIRLSQIRQKNLEERNGDVRKSDTNYTLTTEDTATPTNEIWNKDDDILTPTNNEEEQLMDRHCSACAMHRSWTVLAVLVAVCGKVEICKDDFSKGGVPTRIEDWEKVLRHTISVGERDVLAVCPRCETAMSGVEKALNDGWKNVGLVPDDTRPNVAKIFERFRNVSEEKLLTIIKRKVIKDGEEDGVALTNGHETKNSVPPMAAVVDEQKDYTMNEKWWKWTRGVELKTILALACFCQGKKAVLKMISNNSKLIASKMNTDDWSALVVMSSREGCFQNLISEKKLTEILKSVGCEGLIEPRAMPRATSLIKSKSAPPLSSWIVDTNSKCPMCTILAKVVVGGEDRGVVSYSCGHIYHKACLAGRMAVGCLACRVRARKLAKQSAGNSPVMRRNVK